MDAKEIAKQLRKPEGETGLKVGDNMNTGNGVMNRMVFDFVNVQPGDRILEIGPGNGKLIPVLLKDVQDVFYAGIDYSQDMVNEAWAFNKELIKNKQAEIQQGDFTAIPYPENSFSKVCTINTIYFLDDPLAGLKETWRVLRPGGELFLGIRPKWSISHLPFTQHGFTFYSEEEGEELLKEAGFTDVHHVLKNEGEREFQGQNVAWFSACIMGRKPE